MFVNYKLNGPLKGWTVGVGGTWHSQEEYFSGVTHGSGQIETNALGQLIVAYAPSEFFLNAFAKYEWKRWGYNQFIQLNGYNLTNNNQLYGLIYNQGISGRVSYGLHF